MRSSSSSSNQSLLTECWLKDISDRQKALKFIDDNNNRSINGSKIVCKFEIDHTNLCKNFQIGQCTKSTKDCDWQHIECKEYNTCSTVDCLYGHAKGVKTNIKEDSMLQKKMSYKKNKLILII